MKLRKKVKEASDASPSSESNSSRSAPSEEIILAEFSPESGNDEEPGTSPTASSVGTWVGDSITLEDSDSSLEEVTCTEKDKPPLDCNDRVLRSSSEKSSLNRAKCIRILANANLTIANLKGLNNSNFPVTNRRESVICRCLYIGWRHKPWLCIYT